MPILLVDYYNHRLTIFVVRILEFVVGQEK